MSMNPDVLLPAAISVNVARRIKALVAPPIAYGYKSQQKSGGGNHLCGTTSLDGLTLTSTIKVVLKEFARHGVRNTVLVKGHFENSMFIVEGTDLAIRELRWDGVSDFRVVLLSYWDFVTEDTIRMVFAHMVHRPVIVRHHIGRHRGKCSQWIYREPGPACRETTDKPDYVVKHNRHFHARFSYRGCYYGEFFDLYQIFLNYMVFWTAPWAAIVIVDYFMRNGQYKVSGIMKWGGGAY